MPTWKHTAIHSALMLAIVHSAFVAPAFAGGVCPSATTVISTAVGLQQPCPGDIVTVTSTGSVVGAGIIPVAFGYMGGLAGSLTNAGSISIDGQAGGFAEVAAIDVEGDLSGSLSNSGTISAAASGLAFGVFASKGDLSGSFDNSGKVIASVSGNSMTTFNAIGVSMLDVDGSFSNRGTIAASAAGKASDISAFGVSMHDLSTSFSNTGTLSANASGTALTIEGIGLAAGKLSGDSSNTGIISASASGTASDIIRSMGVYANKLSSSFRETLIYSRGFD